MTDTVADVIAKVLKRNGVDSVFGQSLPSAFFLAAERHGIRQVSYRTENAGGAMADAFARLSGKIGVIGAQNGPAATLLVPPMAEAMTASVPMLALVQEVPTTAADRNAFQEIDHYKLFGGVTKWIKTLRDPARAEEYVEAALRAALSGRHAIPPSDRACLAIKRASSLLAQTPPFLSKAHRYMSTAV